MVEFFSVAAAVSLVFCLILAFLSARIAARVSELSDRVRSLSESPPESLSARLSEAEETLAMLANRVKMMRVRNAVTHTDKPNGADPDPYRDPAAWRQAMNRRLAPGKLPGI